MSDRPVTEMLKELKYLLESELITAENFEEKEAESLKEL